MEPLDLLIEIERYMATKGLIATNTSVRELINALANEEI